MSRTMLTIRRPRQNLREAFARIASRAHMDPELFILAVIALAIVIGLASAARAMDERLEADLRLVVAQPRGEFARENDANGVGVGGHLIYHLPGAPEISFGGDFAWVNYGRRRTVEPFSETIPRVGVDVVTDNNILMGHLVMRLSPARGRVRPFVDVLFGLKNFYTKTAIRDHLDSDFDEPIAEWIDSDDSTVSYGMGYGVDFRLATVGMSDTEDGGQSSPGRLSMTVGARHLWGGRARWLDDEMGLIETEDGDLVYDFKESDTDLLEMYVGLNLGF